jgi:hypothetical protein
MRFLSLGVRSAILASCPDLRVGREHRTHSGRMLDLSSIDLEEIANALADQTD